jgi:hypothetical protein
MRNNETSPATPADTRSSFVSQLILGEGLQVSAGLEATMAVQIKDLLADPSTAKLDGWHLCQDLHTGAIYYDRPDAQRTIWCTPDWEAEAGEAPFIAVEIMDANTSDIVESTRHTYDGTISGFIAVIKPLLEVSRG